MVDMFDDILGGNMKSREQLMQDAFCCLTDAERREIYLLALMINMKTSYRAIAKRHRMSPWFVSACARGKFRMTDRIRKAFEEDLRCDLSQFLLKGEEALDREE